MNTEQPTQNPAPAPVQHPTQKPRRTKRILMNVGLIVLCGLAAFGGTIGAQHFFGDGVTNPLAGISATEDGNAVVTDEEEAVAAVAQAVGPSVVSIITTAQSRSYMGSVYNQAGAGTGIIVSKDGYIMTNNHVIDGASRVSVVLYDGTTYGNVRVVGSDPLNDVAFLKVSDVDDLKPATLGDSSSIRIGQRVVAIGNALGQYQNTVTSGIVSGTGRPITAASADGTSTENLTDLIQTDTAINSGNSGGPLVNAAGQVIGINTAVATDANGIGFAIPINATKGILKGVLEDGEVSKAFMGVRYLDITPGVRSEFNLDASAGAYVYAQQGSAVAANSPADRAGIEDGDIITEVNGQTVGSAGSVSSLIGQYQPGDTVKVSVVRDKEVLSLEMTLTAYAD